MIQEKPLEGIQTDARSHPAGARGAKISLQETADRAWKARMSPRLRAWTTQVIDKAGAAKGGRRQKVTAILDAARNQTFYVADPLMGEFIATPDQILCLDKEKGLCIKGIDCDEYSVLLAAAYMSIGIPAMIIGSSHKEPADVPTHVFCAFQDELDNWVRTDGTTNHPVGQTAQHLREWWLEPGKDAKEKGVGDFVGMSEKDVGVSGSPMSAPGLRYPGIR